MLDEIGDHSSERNTFETEYVYLMSAAQDFIQAHETRLNYEFKPYVTQPVSVKLPDIKLPSFNGNDNEWVSFQDAFVSLIHSKGIWRNS